MIIDKKQRVVKDDFKDEGRRKKDEVISANV
jgi:hypothetical protein